MSLHVACNSCHRTFPARKRPGLVRCPSCEARHGPRLIPAAATVVVIDTPGEPWS